MTIPLPENCIPLLLQAAELDLKIDVKDSRTLTVEPAAKCPQEFADQLRLHKPYLLVLLSLPFVMLNSKTLEETIFFCQDEDTKTALMEAGADSFAIYTKDELRILVEQNRVAPFTPAELRKIHEIKHAFNARITPQ